jgi:transcriptional regulator with XRE-family HTH domain
VARIVHRIKQARLDYQQRIGRDVPIAEVARAIGVTRAALSNLERGRNLPNAETLANLCLFYGLDVGDLLVLEHDAPARPDRLRYQSTTSSCDLKAT